MKFQDLNLELAIGGILLRHKELIALIKVKSAHCKILLKNLNRTEVRKLKTIWMECQYLRMHSNRN
jgi:hypothetical protein